MRLHGAATVLVVVSVLVGCRSGGAEPGTSVVSTPPPSPPASALATTTTTAVPLERSGAFPAQPEGVPWPTVDWATAPWPENVDRTAVDAATDVAFASGGVHRVRAVIIVHGGAIVYERYSPHVDDGPEVVMPSYSMAKSVTSAAIGTLVREGLLDVDEAASVPEWHVDPEDPRAAITVADMLHMSTGMPWQDGLMPGTTMSAMVASDDMAAYAAAQMPTSEPGTVFEYNTGTSILLARMIGDVIGGDADAVEAYLHREIFDRIGMLPIHLSFDEAGTWLGGWSADSTARGYAKFGLLYLRGGEWDGERVLTEDWIEFSRAPGPADPEYGAHWWLDTERPGVFYAIGIRGQVITVDPAHDLVIVQLSTTGGSLPLDHTEAILDAFAAGDEG